MFARIAVVAAALAATSPVFAADSGIADLSRETGVSERHIAMVVGARTAFAEYRTSFVRVERELKAALGKEGYQRLQEGEVAAAMDIHRARAAETAVAEAARAQTRDAERHPPAREG